MWVHFPSFYSFFFFLFIILSQSLSLFVLSLCCHSVCRVLFVTPGPGPSQSLNHVSDRLCQISLHLLAFPSLQVYNLQREGMFVEGNNSKAASGSALDTNNTWSNNSATEATKCHCGSQNWNVYSNLRSVLTAGGLNMRLDFFIFFKAEAESHMAFSK